MDLYKGKPVFNRLKVFIISLLVGEFGLDRIYIGDYTKGLIKFITFGGLGVWYFVDLFHIGIGQKLGNKEYYWKCEIDKTCNAESNLIFKVAGWFFIISIFFILYFYPRNINSAEILRRKNKPENNE